MNTFAWYVLWAVAGVLLGILIGMAIVAYAEVLA